ncbi:MAG: hypothetical protein ACLR5S_10365 [Ruminococcus sp.]
MLLRSAFSFGDILFYSDAKITALQENQKETLSLEERCRILQQENEELKKQVREFTQQNADMRMNSEKLRTTQKQLRTAQDDLDGMKTYCETLRREQQERESAYQRQQSELTFIGKRQTWRHLSPLKRTLSFHGQRSNSPKTFSLPSVPETVCANSTESRTVPLSATASSTWMPTPGFARAAWTVRPLPCTASATAGTSRSAAQRRCGCTTTTIWRRPPTGKSIC